MIDSDIKKFIFSSVDGRKKLLEQLLMGPRIEEPPSPFPKMFLQYKNGLKQGNSGLNLKKVIKNNKTS